MECGQVVDTPPDAKAASGNPRQVLQLMADHLQEAEVQLRGLRSLEMMLEFGHSQQIALCKANGPETIVRAMTSHRQDTSVQGHAALVLAMLVQDNKEAQAAVVRSAAAEALVGTMSQSLQPGAACPEELQASSIVALSALCQGFPEGVARVCSCGGPAAVIAAMQLPSDFGSCDPDGIVQERGCEFFAVIAASGGPNDAASEMPPLLEIVESVFTSMVSLPKNADVHVAACWALSEIVKAGAVGRSTVVSCGGIEALLQAMLRYETLVQVLERGCQVLAAVAEHEQGAHSRCIAAGAAPVVVAALRSMCKRGRKGGMRVACLALAHLATGDDDSRDAIVEADGARAIIEAMHKQSKCSPVQESGLLALHRIATGKAGLSAVREAGGFEAVQVARQLGLEVDVGFVCQLEKQHVDIDLPSEH